MLKREIYLVSTLALLLGVVCRAQSQVNVFKQYEQEIEKKFERQRNLNETSFNSFRDRVNSEFSAYLEKNWKEVSEQEGLPEPLRPEPLPAPVSPSDTVSLQGRPLPYSYPAEPEPDTVAAPSPLAPITEPSYDPGMNSYVNFTYLGMEYKVRVPTEKQFHISDGSNGSVAKAWRKLSAQNFNDMLVDCLCLRKQMNLCDWAMFSMLRSFTAAYYGDSCCADAVVTRAYVLSQLGYKVRMAKKSSTLILLPAFEDEIYSVPYIKFGKDKFYDFDGGDAGNMSICDFAFPGEKNFSARMESLPVTGEANGPSKEFCSEKYGDAHVRVAVNRYLVEFFDKYPSCNVDIIAAAGLSDRLKSQLYPSLRMAMAGKAEDRSVDILLNFVQTGFEYKTDGEQFGREKTFFADELFHYPYSDCEDRAVLFSTLVRDLLHLDVVLLDYPGHISTAVRFSADVGGDYFELDGGKYVVCDPTYIGASIGCGMPSLIGQKAGILRIR